MIEYVSGTVNEISQMNEVFPEFGFCIPCKEEVRLNYHEYYLFVYCSTFFGLSLSISINTCTSGSSVLCPD